MNELEPIYCFVSKEKDTLQDFTCLQLQIDQNLNCEVHVLASKAENARAEPWREKDHGQQKGYRMKVAAILSHPPPHAQIPDLHPCHK